MDLFTANECVNFFISVVQLPEASSGAKQLTFQTSIEVENRNWVQRIFDLSKVPDIGLVLVVEAAALTVRYYTADAHGFFRRVIINYVVADRTFLRKTQQRPN